MGDGLLQTIRQVGIFVICAQMILHFKPAESYGKYIRLLVSVMVLVQLIVPIMDIFLKTEAGSLPERISYYQDILSEDMEDINVTCNNAEQMLNMMTMEEIKSRINNMNEQADEQNNSDVKNGIDSGNASDAENTSLSDNAILSDEVTETDDKKKDQDILIERIEVLTDD